MRQAAKQLLQLGNDEDGSASRWDSTRLKRCRLGLKEPTVTTSVAGSGGAVFEGKCPGEPTTTNPSWKQYFVSWLHFFNVGQRASSYAYRSFFSSANDYLVVTIGG